MKILVAGASGALGSRLVPQLVANGHTVTGTTRTAGRFAAIERLGATPVVMDGLDADSVGAAVSQAEPDVIVHQLTALAGSLNPRRFGRDFAMTNRLRTEGTDHLLSAARAAGVGRFVAQSYAGWPYEQTGGPVKTEDAPLDPDPPKAMRGTLDAIRHLEGAVTAAGGIVLRYGGFYGPGTSLSLEPLGEHVEMVRARKFPIVGAGTGIWSFIHVDDAAAATVAAVERGAPGIYNIVDDEPAAVSEWLPVLAGALGAKPPMRVPTFVGRLAGGAAGAALMLHSRGASNAKAKRELGWTPRYASWREGVVSGLGREAAATPTTMQPA